MQLQLEDNSLDGSDLKELQIYRNLKIVNLSNNKITDLDVLKPLVSSGL